MGTENKPIDTLAQWVGQTGRRISAQERRSQVYSGLDLLGPGLVPTAAEIYDWNDDDATFNGFFWSRQDALNSPGSTEEWVGVAASRDDNTHGVQRAWSLKSFDPPKTYVRRWVDAGDGSMRTYTQWRRDGGDLDVIIHGDDGTVARTDFKVIYWVGGATPDNGIVYDFWYPVTI